MGQAAIGANHMNDLRKSDLEAIGASGANASSEPMSIVVFEEPSQFRPSRGAARNASLLRRCRPDEIDTSASSTTVTGPQAVARDADLRPLHDLAGERSRRGLVDALAAEAGGRAKLAPVAGYLRLRLRRS